MRKIYVPAILCCCAGLVLWSSAVIRSATPSVLLQVADTYRYQGRYLEALSFYRDISMNPWGEQAGVTLYRGIADICYEYLGDVSSALDLYTSIIEKFPGEPRIAEVYHRIAKIHYQQGRRDRAITFYQDVLTLFPVYYKEHSVARELKALEAGDAFFEDVTLSVERPLPRCIRVLLAEAREPVTVSSPAGVGIYAPDASFFEKIHSDKPIQFCIREGGLHCNGMPLLGGSVRIKTDEPHRITFNGRPYRGFLWLRIENGRLLVINHVELEEYLYGVLPREIPPSWPEHALKAQAVAARTYALYHMLKREQALYDVFSTTASQVYGGTQAEHRHALQAVDQTRGLVMSFENKVVLSLYHANSGGWTECPEDVWGSRIPYLTTIEDTFSMNRPGHAWKQAMSPTDIQSRLQEFGYPVHGILKILPVERTASGRITKLQILQDTDSFYLSGNSFRLVVGPSMIKSSNFDVAKDGQDFVFTGKGYGHGVGLSQWGAYGMATRGYDYKAILGFYYPGTALAEIRT